MEGGNGLCPPSPPPPLDSGTVGAPTQSMHDSQCQCQWNALLLLRRPALMNGYWCRALQGGNIEKEMILQQLSVYWSVGPASVGSQLVAAAGGSPGAAPGGSSTGGEAAAQRATEQQEQQDDLLLQPLHAVLQLRMQAGGADAMLSVNATVPLLAVHLQPHQVPLP